MKIINIEQGTDEWFRFRAGKPTASKFGQIVTSTGKKSKSWGKYAAKCAYDSMVGCMGDSFQSEAMARGVELESQARGIYELITDRLSGEVGIVTNNDGTVSCSPDGLYWEKGLEIKCPNYDTHKGYIAKDLLPTTYKPQVYGSLWLCDEVDSWDFFSYHPELKPFLTTVDRDDKEYKNYAKSLDENIPLFLADVAVIIEKIK